MRSEGIAAVAFFGMWLLMILLSLAWVGVCIWALIRVVNHFAP